jgi:phospholipase D1/2
MEEVREIEALFLDGIDQARRSIYIENQFTTSRRIAERLAKRLQEQASLEALIIVPQAHRSWLESQTMASGRSHSIGIRRASGVGDHVAILSPHVRNGAKDVDVMVHSELMIVDDVLVHVGSANLNNRSIGLDTECDIAIEARTQAERKAVERLRNRLLGHHCGVGPDVVTASLTTTGSLMRTALTLRGGGHYLAPVNETAPPPPLSTLESLADPERPIPPPWFIETIVGERPKARPLRRLAKVIAAGAVIVALMLAWRFTPLASLARLDTIRQWLAAIAEAPAAPLFVIAAFIGGGLVVFPVVVLIAATAAAFGPWLGFAYSFAGALASAVVTYAIGAAIGRRALESVLGARLDRVRRAIVERGVFAIAALRLVPIAPFTLVNVAAGASKVRLSDYLIGTAIGMAPGITTMSALGYQIWTIVAHPSLANLAIFLLVVAGWLAVTLGAQALILRHRRHRHHAA